MAANDVITAYERLSHVLYEHGKNDRRYYDVEFQGELYQRMLKRLQAKTGKTEKFLIKKQEEVLIYVAEHLKLEVEEYPSESVYTVKCAWSIEPDDYEQIEEVRCSAHLTAMLLSLTESVATIKVDTEKLPETCPINRLPILELIVTMIF